jgi:phage terminase small subunit
MEDNLTGKQLRYVENIAKGMSLRDAALKAGYSLSFSKVAAGRLGQSPAVAQAIAGIRAEARKIACYDVSVAMDEALDAIAFARAKGNAMAVVKGVELRSKLSGLLIDRVLEVTVDLTDALARAEARLTDMTASGTGAPRSISWQAQIPGTPVAAQEAGQAEVKPEKQA